MGRWAERWGDPVPVGAPELGDGLRAGDRGDADVEAWRNHVQG